MDSAVKKSELEWYASLSNKINKHEEFNELAYKRYINLFLKETEITFDDRVLELGCGTGAFTSRLLKRGYNIIGLDLSDKMLLNAKTLSHKNIYVQGDMELLPFLKNKFDVIFASASLHHLPDLYRCASESFRVLRRGGRFFSIDPNGLNPLAWAEVNNRFIRKSICKRSMRSFGCTPNERLITEKEVKKVFRDIGFKHITTYTINFVPYKKSKFLRKFENLFERTLILNKFGGTLVHKSVKV
jgi:ubiquinone/menaquinone biosynthesis C-methylase UbiE